MTVSALADGSRYPARLSIDYSERHNRLTTLVRVFMVIPIAIVLILVSGGGGSSTTVPTNGPSGTMRTTGAGIGASLTLATALMIIFRRRYPRWWFDFELALARFSVRVSAYLLLLRDEYPSTEDEQAVHLELDYPDTTRDLNRWLPLVKWLLAVPHYVVLLLLGVLAVLAVLVAWVAILVTGRYPRPLFDFVVGTIRWVLRVQAYAFLLITDRYPPFSLR